MRIDEVRQDAEEEYAEAPDLDSFLQGKTVAQPALDEAVEGTPDASAAS